MLTSQLFWRIFTACAATVLFAAAMFGMVLTSQQHSAGVERTQQQLLTVARTLKAWLGEEAFNQKITSEQTGRLSALGRETGVRLTLISADGAVLFDSQEDASLLSNHAGLPEILQAKKDAAGIGVANRVSKTAEQPTIYVALSIGDPASPAGFIRASSSIEAIESQVSVTKRLVGWSALALTILLFVIMWRLTSRMVRPLHELTGAAEAIGRGEMDRHLSEHTRDEIGMLGASFNRMTQGLVVRFRESEDNRRQLEENAQRISTVLAGMIEGVVAVDRKERILVANKAAGMLLDFDASHSIGRPLWEVIRIPTIQQVTQAALSGGETAPVEFEVPRMKAVIAMLASRLPGRPCPGVVLVMHDVTELRRLENLRREFVSNVSHELKTPLTSIQAYTETLLGGAIDDPPHNRQFLERIQEQANRLHLLILDVLRLARIEAGADVFDVTRVNVEQVIQSCLEEHSAVAESKNVRLSGSGPEMEIHVKADSEGLRTIIDNLVDNAINYTPAGGRVQIRWRSEGSMGLIEVEDTGVGIPEKHHARIFERFYRVDKARSREVGGTGLGLSIVKHFVQVFEGTVTLKSKPGAGTTFFVRLPLA